MKHYDLTKTYLVPMQPIGSTPKDPTVVVEAPIKINKHKNIIVEKEGYITLEIYDFYFDWQLYTGYIKEKVYK